MNEPDHHIKQIFNAHRVFIGALMRMEGNDIIIALNNIGEFVGRFDGNNTYTLPDGKWYCNDNSCYELVLKNFNEDKSINTPTGSHTYYMDRKTKKQQQ
jgi:hypothetical protein